MSELDPLRQQLDQINGDICSLLMKRFELLKQIAEIKKHRGLELYDSERETLMLQHIQKNLGSHPASSHILVVFLSLLKEGLKYMKKQ